MTRRATPLSPYSARAASPDMALYSYMEKSGSLLPE